MNKKATILSVPITHVFQPIIETQTSSIYGYEALMRGAKKASLPEKLFRDAYKQGCVIDLDMHALEVSLKSLPKIQKGKMLFVNIEPMTLGACFGKQKNADPLLKLIKPHSKKIVFELTERLKPWDFKFVKKGITMLKRIGAKFALDDVGSVSSELLRLITLKPDFMKIDKELVRNLGRKSYQQESLIKLVEFGKRHKLKMIAEGVEKKIDADFIRELGIHYAQGFYFARPHKTMYASLRSYQSK